MTDHYAEAQRLIDGLHNLEGHSADFDMALAQVHATLALAEQQRIANVHTLGQSYAEECEVCSNPYPYCDGQGHQDHYVAELRPDIASALRIAQEES